MPPNPPRPNLPHMPIQILEIHTPPTPLPLHPPRHSHPPPSQMLLPPPHIRRLPHRETEVLFQGNVVGARGADVQERGCDGLAGSVAGYQACRGLGVGGCLWAELEEEEGGLAEGEAGHAGLRFLVNIYIYVCVCRVREGGCEFMMPTYRLEKRLQEEIVPVELD